MELIINGVTYQFNFGMGFLRTINRQVRVPVDGLKDVKKDVGARYLIASVMDGEPDALVELLCAANVGQNPRVTPALLDSYIDDENTDIDALFEDTLDFLKSAHATRKLMQRIADQIEESQANR